MPWNPRRYLHARIIVMPPTAAAPVPSTTPTGGLGFWGLLLRRRPDTTAAATPPASNTNPPAHQCPECSPVVLPCSASSRWRASTATDRSNAPRIWRDASSASEDIKGRGIAAPAVADVD